MSDTVVFVPAWNEEGNLPAVLEDLHRELPDVDVLVVDDGSTDGTAAVARAGNAEVLSLGSNRGLPIGIAAGYGWALEHGYAFCGRVDADGQHPAAELARLLALVRADHCDVAVGSRFVSGDGHEPGRYRPERARRFGTAVLRRAMGVVLRRPFADATSGLYAVNAKALPLLARPFTTEAPEVEALIRIVDAGLRLEEVPVHMDVRAGGESKLRGSKAVKVVLTVTVTLVAAKLLQARESAVTLRRLLLGAASLAVVVATFFFLLPTIADYGDVWDVVTQLSWQWIVALLVATALNLASFAPPWQAALPGLPFVQALELTQASTALSLVVPGGPAAGMASSFGMLRSWGFAPRNITRALTLVGLWNQFLNLTFPIVALFLLTATGEETALLGTAAFVGVAVLGVVVSGFVLVLVSDRLASELGEVAARLATWARGKFRRGPVTWGGPSFERFRDEAGELLRRRWHVLTVASLCGSLTVFLVLLVSLRALDVPASEVSVAEAFAAWSLMRLIGSIPITPGGIGVVELGLTSALVAFGGQNAGVVAAVLVFRFLTMVPTLLLGLVAAWTWRRHRPPAAAEAPVPDPGR